MRSGAPTMQALMTNDQAASLFDSLLFDICGVRAGEVGLSHSEALKKTQRCKSRLQVKHAVLAFAADHDLSIRGE